jgi:sugar O-acyltransferase (sialic acid O-acetyltransferase NeuD family)
MLYSASRIRSIVIVGVGGFGKEVYDYLMQSASVAGPTVAGFLDDNPAAQVPAGIDLPFLGRVDDYQPQTGQAAVVAIGSVRSRRSVLECLWERGVETPAYAAEMAQVSPAAQLGRGVIVCPFAIINRDAVLAAGVAVNVHCSVGHGAQVGAYSVLSPYAALNGDAVIGAECFLGTRATIYPGVSIGRECVIDSHTGVRADAPDRRMISSRGAYRVTPLRNSTQASVCSSLRAAHSV